MTFIREKTIKAYDLQAEDDRGITAVASYNELQQYDDGTIGGGDFRLDFYNGCGWFNGETFAKFADLKKAMQEFEPNRKNWHEQED